MPDSKLSRVARWIGSSTTDRRAIPVRSPIAFILDPTQWLAYIREEPKRRFAGHRSLYPPLAKIGYGVTGPLSRALSDARGNAGKLLPRHYARRCFGGFGIRLVHDALRLPISAARCHLIGSGFTNSTRFTVPSG
jgi:hypothetical protein